MKDYNLKTNLEDQITIQEVVGISIFSVFLIVGVPFILHSLRLLLINLF